MKYSNTTLRELSARYRHVLRKCALFNIAVLMGVALSAPATAATITNRIVVDSGETTISAGDIVTVTETTAGAAYVKNSKLIVENNVVFQNNPNHGLFATGTAEVTLKDGVKFIGNKAQQGAAFHLEANTSLVGGNNITLQNNESAGNYTAYMLGNASFGDNFKVINNKARYAFFISNGANISFGDGFTIKQEADFQADKLRGIEIDGNSEDSLTFANNVLFENLGRAFAINSNKSITIGNNAQFINTEEVFDILGENSTVLVGDNALFSKGKTVALQISDKDSSITVGKGAIFKDANTEGEASHLINNTGKDSFITLKGATFENNTVEESIIYNGTESVLNLSGDMTFTGNTADFDIVNDGVMNISGDVTLNLQHGISSANGSVVFKANSSLTTALNTSTAMFVVKSAEIESNAKLNLIIDPATKDGKYAFITATDGITGAFSSVLEKNALYDITMDADGFVDIKAQSKEVTVENIVDTTGATQQEAETMAAITGVKGNGTAVGNQIATALSEAIQLAGDSSNPAAASEAAKVAKKAAETLAPTNSAVSMGIASKTTALLADVTNNRLLTLSGRAGGDAFVGGGLWVQGLYNYSKQDASTGSTGFEANAEGIGFGIDGKINEDWSVGVGYGYLHTDAEAGEKDLKVNEHNIFVYGEYHPNNFYVNGMLKYGFAQYDEEKAPLGIAMKADYNVQSYAANLMTGYHFDTGFAPEAGLRYIYLNQDKYFDGAQDIKTDNNDVLTAIAGLKYSKDFTRRDWTFRPELSAMMTYDIFSSDTDAMVNVIGGGSYQVSGKRLHRLGTELGVGMKASISDIDINVEYKAGLREDYQSHTGMVRAKYNF